jgi:hypothetical protein
MTNLTVDTTIGKPLPTPRMKLPPDTTGEFALFGWFAFLTPEAEPEPEINIATIPLIPNAWIVSAFPTEVRSGGLDIHTPNIGAAQFNIQSIQVDTVKQVCQVIFTQNWPTSLPCGLNMIIGYIPEDTLSEQ